MYTNTKWKLSEKEERQHWKRALCVSSIYPAWLRRHRKAYGMLFSCIQPFIIGTNDLKGICKISSLTSQASKCLTLTCNSSFLSQLAIKHPVLRSNSSPPGHVQVVCPCWQWHRESWAKPQSTNRSVGAVTGGNWDIMIPPAGNSTTGYVSGCLRPPGDRKCSCTCPQMALASTAYTKPQLFMWITQWFQMTSLLKWKLPLSLRKLISLQGWLYKNRGTVLAGCLHHGCSDLNCW